MALLRHLTTLLCAVLHGTRPAAAQNRTAVVDYPARVEFNVVFPRNETYAPAPVFPIVFAVQNYPAAAVSSSLSIDYKIRRYPDMRILKRSRIRLDEIDPHYNTSVADPYYVVLWSDEFSGDRGQYAVEWEFSHVNCSAEVVAAYDSDFEKTSYGAYLYVFSLAADGKQPDVGADLHTCPGWYSAAFEISGTTPVLESDRRSRNDGRSVCAVVSETPPLVDPCAVRIEESAAASISARITASACAERTPVLTSGCPPPSPTQTQPAETNLGSGAPVGGGSGMGLTGMLSLVLALAGFLLFLVL